MLTPGSIVTPKLFEEHGCPPVLASPDALYTGFHIEWYIHTLPEIETLPIQDALAVLLLRPCRTERRVDGHTKKLDMAADTVTILPQGQPAHWHWEDVVDVIHFRPEARWLDRVRQMSSAEGNEVELSDQLSLSDPQMQRLMLSLHAEVEAGCPSGRLFGEHLASVLAVHLLTQYATYPARIKEYVRGLGKSDLSRVLAFISDRLADDLSLEDLAACCHLSPYHFCRLFKQSSGQSPHQYVIAQRVEKAKSLLRCGGLSVGEVAYAVGFGSQAHLNRHFKRITGLTPGQFRKGR